MIIEFPQMVGIYDETYEYRGFTIRISGVTDCPVPAAYVWQVSEFENPWALTNGSALVVPGALRQAEESIDHILSLRHESKDL
jgi:hypothetical protein